MNVQKSGVRTLSQLFPEEHRGLWMVALALVTGATTLGILFYDAQYRSNNLLLTLDGQELRSLSTRDGSPVGDLWQRVQAIGVHGIYLAPMATSTLIERGDALYFSRVEAEKWRAAGLVAPSSPFRSNAIWLRQREMFQHVYRAAQAQDVHVSTQTLGELLIVNFPESTSAESFSLGFDALDLKEGISQGLLPVFHARDTRSVGSLVSQSIRALGPDGKSVFLLGPGVLAPKVSKPASLKATMRIDDLEPMLDLADRRRSWLALPVGISSGLGECLSPVAPRVLKAKFVHVSQGMTPVWRAVFGRGARILIIRLSVEDGVEWNMDRLRQITVQLKKKGFALDLRQDAAFVPEKTPWFEQGVRYLLALLLGIFGPLVAMREALQLLRKISTLHRWPQASPVLEIAGAAAAASGVALIVGMVAYAFLAFPEWKAGLVCSHWSFWTTGLPFSIGVLGLYWEGIKEWRERWRKPMTYRQTAFLAGTAMLLCFLASPARALEKFGLFHWLVTVRAMVPPGLWWLLDDWREVLIGFPALVIGLWIHLGHLQHSGGREVKKHGGDPRPWLLLAILAPAGIIGTYGMGQVPPELLLIQTFYGAFLGSALGGFFILSWYGGCLLRRRLSGCPDD